MSAKKCKNDGVILSGGEKQRVAISRAYERHKNINL
ncbi:MAG: hypothetical protein LBS11_00205 [Oscillospiraceae bacterium]|nr:hypothetical protein [Oscillospiraceae bacterium]